MTAPDILFVTRKWAPAVGGMETWSHQITDELTRLAPCQVVALPGRSNGLPPGALALLGFPFTVLQRYLSRQHAPDVLHLGDMALWPLGLLARLRRGQTRVVLSAHGTDVSYARRQTWRGAAYRAYLRLGARLLPGALVLPNSSATAAAARETGWQRTRIVPLATTLRGPHPGGAPQPHLLFVGRLIPLKGCAWFIRTVLPLLPEGLALHVAGTAVDPAEHAALDHPRVRYLGTLGAQELAQAYAASLCVVVPNIEPADGTFEGFGLVATEAAAAGGVVLAANCGGLPQAVIDQTTGFLIPPGQPEDWAAAVNEVAQWPATRRHSFISGSLEAVEAQFRWPRVAALTLTAYRSLDAD
jgi:glycosyltransferase involved in cell wall biosynthesis